MKVKTTKTVKIEGPLNNEPVLSTLATLIESARKQGAPEDAKVSLSRYAGSSHYDDRGSWSVTITWSESE